MRAAVLVAKRLGLDHTEGPEPAVFDRALRTPGLVPDAARTWGSGLDRYVGRRIGGPARLTMILNRLFMLSHADPAHQRKWRDSRGLRTLADLLAYATEERSWHSALKHLARSLAPADWWKQVSKGVDDPHCQLIGVRDQAGRVQFLPVAPNDPDPEPM